MTGTTSVELLVVRSLPGVDVLPLTALLPRRVISVEPPKQPNFFTGRGVVLLAELLFDDDDSIVRVLDLDLEVDVVVLLLVVVMGSLPRDLDRAEFRS